MLLLIFMLYGTIVPAKLTSHSPHSLIIKDVTTDIDISSQLLKINHIISLCSSTNNLQYFVYNVSPSLVNRVANITTTDYGMKENLLMKYRFQGVWEIIFEKPLHQDECQIIRISVIVTHVLKPFPSRVTQFEKHFILFSGPISLYSPYLILNHTTLVTRGNGDLLSVMPPPDFQLINESPLTFISPNISQERFLESHAKIHYEHLKTFLTVKLVVRAIEISHWGTISVTEAIELEHSGAKFYGPFQRRLQGNRDAMVIDSINTFLPASATDILVFDDVGKILSIRVTEQFDCVEMKFNFRFLLYGGWKVKYILQYNVPSYEYLYNEDDEFLLKMRTIDHIFNDMVIDKAIVKIILPEGSEKGSLQTPFHVHHLNESCHISYLDTIGRPVISFVKENLVEDHIQDFVLTYTFTKYKMLLEPIYVITFLEILFILVIISNRVDFTISEMNEIKRNNCESIVPVMKQSVSSTKTKKKLKRLTN